MRHADRTYLRNEAMRQRAALPPAERKKKSRLIQQKILNSQFMEKARVIAIYMSMQFEVESDFLFDTLLAMKKPVYAPRVLKGKKMEFARITAWNDLVPGVWNIPEPQKNLPGLRPDEFSPDLMIVPGAAFDLYGNRLGYGGGYYDRFLAACPRTFPLLAPTFECQLVPEIEAMPWDVAMDFIITENACHAVRKQGIRA